MKIKILIANSVGVDEKGDNYILFPSRWTANVGKTKSFNFYPYELAYLSSLLKSKNKWCVKMIDGNYEKLDWKNYFKKYQSEVPDFLIMETSSLIYENDLKFALEFKKKYNTKIVFCGQHATAFPDRLIKDGVDFVCIGEYEYTVLDIIDGKNIKTIDGLYPNKRRVLLDIDSLPFPEDDDISRFNYINIGGCDYKEIEFFASRGCMMNCVFCVARQTYYDQPNFRPRKVESIIKEIKYLKQKYPKMEGIFFDEENHNTSKEFIFDLCREIKKNKLENLKYDAMCGYWTLDKKMLKEMKSAGYYKIRIGIESISQETCKGMKKNINVEKMLETLENAKKIGMKMYGTFTFGAPGSTLAQDNATLDFMEKLINEDLLYDFQASVCTPQPGTPFYNNLKKDKYLLTEDWSKYNGGTAVYEYPNYKKAEIESNMKRAYKIYLRVLIKRRGYLNIIYDEFLKTGFKGLIIKGQYFLRNFSFENLI